MNKATVYTRPLCPFCVRALTLLQKKGVEVEEISAAFDRDKREEMLARSNGRTTYPQIFIGDVHVGGCDELLALERDGKLDGLLNG
ncbi:MAG: glutaredoxin 3 [Parvularculaceae bacterium]|nr:glutaredoxin 3 [Parvularculaceae bacterium]